MRTTITDVDEIYTGFGPREASKSRTSSCYSCIACIRRDCDYNVAMPMRESMITIGAIYTHDQLALQVKESCLSQSPGAIQRYSSLNKVVVSLWVFSDPESVVGNMEVRVPGGMAST